MYKAEMEDTPPAGIIAFILLVGLRFHVADHIAGRFQLEPFPVCLLQQVETVKVVLLV